MLNWSNRFNIFCFLNSNNYTLNHSEWQLLFAADPAYTLELTNDDFALPLKQFSEEHTGWIFGHLNYPGSTKDKIAFTNGFFFIPKILIKVNGNELIISTHDSNPDLIFNQINETAVLSEYNDKEVKLKSEMSKDEYCQAIEAVKEHLQQGDCYELNFCQTFFAEQVQINPFLLYQNLINISPSPFSTLYRIEDKFCISASPERFLKKKGDTLISQPIKGTSKRDLKDAQKDLLSKQYLKESEKEKSENVMIVDLVRNDLSKVSARGSVKVDELMGIYSFPQVHQMISTITGKLDESFHWTDAIDACFPMGSMTGAPKKKVMELISTYEKTPRGLFSGSIGYIDPSGDFDFNVIIRSYFYDAQSGCLLVKAGGGITIKSDPDLEYEESLLKVEVLKKILTSPNSEK
jgi:para-aminobenzoate synthetase component 1